MEPKVTMPEEAVEVEKVLDGKSDLAYRLALEVLPKIELADFSNIKLERLVADVTEAEIDAAVQKFAEETKPYNPKGEGAKVENGDRAMINFSGKIDGAPFEGGTGEDVGVNVGSGTFIPGFEEQLIGMAVGETRLVKVTFPSTYTSPQLAGKDAEFEVTVKSIDAARHRHHRRGFRQVARPGIARQAARDAQGAAASRSTPAKAARSSSASCSTSSTNCTSSPAPPTLIEEEFKNVWNVVENDLKTQGRTFADEGTTEEKAREEYHAIAERRVRLGLVLAEIGERNAIQVTDDELSRDIVERTRQFPGREQEIWDYYRKNPAALASVRAPLFEEKVVDFILELAKVTEKQVSREELYQGGRGADARQLRIDRLRPKASAGTGGCGHPDPAMSAGTAGSDMRRLATFGGMLRRRPRLRCSFCRRDAAAVARLVAGASAHICDECITKCVAVLEQHGGFDPAAGRRDGAAEIG